MTTTTLDALLDSLGYESPECAACHKAREECATCDECGDILCECTGIIETVDGDFCAGCYAGQMPLDVWLDILYRAR